MDSRLSPLTSVTVVCRQIPGTNSTGIADLMSEFIDGSANWIVSEIPHDLMSVRFLKRIRAREVLDPLISDQFFRDYLLNEVANAAATHGNLEVLKWLATEYSLGSVMTKAVWLAAESGCLEVVKWLYEEYPFVVVGFEELWQAATHSHLEVVKYLLANPPPREYRMPQLTDQRWANAVHKLLRSDEVFQRASLEYLQWALESGYVRCGWKLHKAAISKWFARYMDNLLAVDADMQAIQENETTGHA